MVKKNLLSRQRFGFGLNWRSYSKRISFPEIEHAKKGLIKLLPENYSFINKSFIDIGCGSGIHSIAAYSLNFKNIIATDFDQVSVNTTITNMETFNVKFDVFQDDILKTKVKRKFDIVYSWGVLHHTGNLRDAINNSKNLVNDDGFYIIAIYKKTLFCKMWYLIKKTFCYSPELIKKIQIFLFYSLRLILYILKGKLIKNYSNERGMNLYYDAVDWLGGYPYESASKENILTLVGEKFTLVKCFKAKPKLGLMGTACSEYVFQRK